MNASAVHLSLEEGICRQVALDVYGNILQYSGVVLALPLHLLIIFLILWKISLKRFYHFLIIGQSLVDIVQVLCIFITQFVCVLFKKILATNNVINYTPSIQMVLTVYLMIYWKSTITPQKLLDPLFYLLAALATVGSIAEKIFRQRTDAPQYALPFAIANTIANVVLSVICFSSFFMVMKMTVSRFIGINLTGQKKLTIALLLQFILVIITNIFDTMISYANYAALTNPYVIEANIKARNATDIIVLEAYRAELYDNTKLLRAVAENLEIISTAWTTFLPLVRGIIMCWALWPLVRRKSFVTSSLTTEG